MHPKNTLLWVAVAATVAPLLLASIGAQDARRIQQPPATQVAQQVLAAPAAANADSDTPPAVAEFLSMTQPPRETFAKVSKVVRGLNWKPNLRRAARDAERLDRPILWIQAYGKLDGYA